jgi:hypothetical protein
MVVSQRGCRSRRNLQVKGFSMRRDSAFRPRGALPAARFSAAANSHRRRTKMRLINDSRFVAGSVSSWSEVVPPCKLETVTRTRSLFTRCRNVYYFNENNKNNRVFLDCCNTSLFFKQWDSRSGQSERIVLCVGPFWEQMFGRRQKHASQRCFSS